MQKPGFETSYKWKKTTDYYESGQIREMHKSKNLRRYTTGTGNKSARIEVIKRFDINGRTDSKRIVLNESGGCYDFKMKTDTIRCAFPKLYLRRIKYMFGF